MICPVCGFENKDGSVLCQGCNFNFEDGIENGYRESINAIGNIADVLSKTFGTFPEDKLEAVYSSIVSRVYKVLEENRADFKNNVMKLKNKLGTSLSGDDKAETEEKIENVVAGFEGASGFVDDGLAKIKASLYAMKNPKDIIQGQKGVDDGLVTLSQGLAALRQCCKTMIDMGDIKC